jgi:phenylacetic acid degradation operon negative regulatory protein
LTESIVSDTSPLPTLAALDGVRSDSSPSVDTTRGLLLTVLGEFVLPHAGRAWTQTLVTLMDRLGVRDKATRQALARMEQRDWLAREKVGRQTRWLLTPDLRALLEPGAKRIYEFGQRSQPWDASWVVLLTSVPERERHLRYRMGVGLSWAGFGSIGPGVWISPWREDERFAVELLQQLGVDGTTFRAELGELGAPRSLAAAAWDLPELRRAYERFLDDTATLVRGSASGLDAAASLTTLVHSWRRLPLLDPDLPLALLPDDWPRPDAARRFAELRGSLGLAAARWWDATEAELDR